MSCDLTWRQLVEELNRLQMPGARGGQRCLIQFQRVLRRLGMTLE
jgi:hypothetical protein